MKLVTVSQMQAIEKEADANGLAYDQMMQNAGRGLAEIVLDLFLDEVEPEAMGLVGPGNNGGDTLVALTRLAGEGWKASAYLVKRKKDDLVKDSWKLAAQSLAARALSSWKKPLIQPMSFWMVYLALASNYR